MMKPLFMGKRLPPPTLEPLPDPLHDEYVAGWRYGFIGGLVTATWLVLMGTLVYLGTRP